MARRRRRRRARKDALLRGAGRALARSPRRRCSRALLVRLVRPLLSGGERSHLLLLLLHSESFPFAEKDPRFLFSPILLSRIKLVDPVIFIVPRSALLSV